MENYYETQPCTQCKYYFGVYKHPWNENEWSKGQIDEKMGDACAFDLFNEPLDSKTGIQRLFFSDREHGSCELFTRKEVKE